MLSVSRQLPPIAVSLALAYTSAVRQPDIASLLDPPEQQPLTADRLLTESRRVYATCETYRDYGVFYEAEDDSYVEFITAVRRPGTFRLEFIAPTWTGDSRWQWVTWRIGEESAATTWYTGLAEPEQSRLLGFVRGAIIDTFNKNKPLVFDEDLRFPAFLELPRPVLAGEEVVRGRRCHRIDTRLLWNDEPMASVWLDQQTKLVRRFQRRTTSGFDLTELEPEINTDIDDRWFRFDHAEPDNTPMAALQRNIAREILPDMPASGVIEELFNPDLESRKWALRRIAQRPRLWSTLPTNLVHVLESDGDAEMRIMAAQIGAELEGEHPDLKRALERLAREDDDVFVRLAAGAALAELAR